MTVVLLLCSMPCRIRERTGIVVKKRRRRKRRRRGENEAAGGLQPCATVGHLRCIHSKQLHLPCKISRVLSVRRAARNWIKSLSRYPKWQITKNSRFHYLKDRIYKHKHRSPGLLLFINTYYIDITYTDTMFKAILYLYIYIYRKE